MSIDIQLLLDKGFAWHSTQELAVKGYGFDQAGHYLSAERLAQQFAQCDTVELLQQQLAQINGCFALVCRLTTGQVIVACDRIRSIPLFYDQARQCITDNIAGRDEKIDANILAQHFLPAGLSPGQHTLFADVLQVQAGQYLLIEPNGKIKTEWYYTHVSQPQIQSDLEQDKNVLWESLHQRIADSVKNHTVWLPLSAGLDSRWLALALHQHGVRNVVAFSYGEKHNTEWRLAEKIAEKLGYEFVFVPYDKALYQRAFNDEQTRQYACFAAQHTSQPHLQDYFALWQLQQDHVINTDAVFMPGHSGDFLGGSWLRRQSNMPASWDWMQRVARQHYTDHQALAVRRADWQDSIASADNVSDNLLADRWNVLHRQAQYIVNAVRVYEFFGYAWRLPLWDAALMDFWYRQPLSDRVIHPRYRKDLLAWFAQKQLTFPQDSPNWIMCQWQRGKDKLGVRSQWAELQSVLHKMTGKQGDVNALTRQWVAQECLCI